MKKLKPVNITIDATFDTDKLNQNLTDCVEQIDADQNVINLVKVHVGDNISSIKVLNAVLKNIIVDPLKDLGVNNVIFVPIKPGFIEDISVEYIEVRNNELDN